MSDTNPILDERCAEYEAAGDDAERAEVVRGWRSGCLATLDPGTGQIVPPSDRPTPHLRVVNAR